MKISISRMSWHAMTYKWFYDTYRLPSSLCLYFWKLVLALVLAPPVHLLSLPAYVLVNTLRRSNGFRRRMKGSSPRGMVVLGMLLYACIVLFSLWCAHILYLMGLQTHPFPGPFIFACIIMMGSIGVIIGALYTERKTERENTEYKLFIAANPTLGWSEFHHELQKKKWYYSLNPANWLMFMYIRAWIQDLCPFIEWKH